MLDFIQRPIKEFKLQQKKKGGGVVQAFKTPLGTQETIQFQSTFHDDQKKLTFHDSNQKRQKISVCLVCENIFYFHSLFLSAFSLQKYFLFSVFINDFYFQILKF